MQHGGFFAFAFAPDGKTVAGGTGVVKFLTNGKEQVAGGGEVILWDAQTGKLKQTLGSNGDSIHWLAFSADGRTLASGSEDNHLVKIWDLPEGKFRRSVLLQGKYAKSGSFGPMLFLTPDGGTLVSVLDKTTVLRSGKDKSGNEQSLTASEGADLTAWDTKTGAVRWKVDDTHLRTCALAPDGQRLVGYVEKTGKWVPQGEAFIAQDVSRQLTAWDLKDGKATLLSKPENLQLSTLLFLPDGNTLLGGNSQGMILLDPRTGSVQKQMPWESSRWAFSTLAVSADGKSVAHAWSEYVERLDLATGKSTALLSFKFPEMAFNVAFTSDLQRFACSLPDPVVMELPAK
jgi:WD40 repeat protein